MKARKKIQKKTLEKLGNGIHKQKQKHQTEKQQRQSNGFDGKELLRIVKSSNF